MDLNLENISKINTGSSYYLSDNGEIKKSGLLHKFKCFFNLGHSRERVANLVNAIRNTLVTASNENGKTELDAQIRNISTKSALQGSAIKALADHFITTNKSEILQNQAKKFITKKLNNFIGNLVDGSQGKIKNSEGLKSLLISAVQKYIDNPPTKQKDGLPVISEETLQQTVDKELSKLGNLIKSISLSEALGEPDISDDYADYLKSELSEVIKGNISYDDFSIEKLKNPDEAYTDSLNSQLRMVKNTPENKAIVESFVKYVSEELKDDPELQSFVRKVGVGILVRGDNSLRSFDSFTKKIDGIKNSLQELRELNGSNPKLYDIGKSILESLHGESFPKGAIASQMNFINSADLSDIEKINAGSSSMDLHKAVLQLRNVMKDAARNLPSKLSDTGEDYMLAFRALQMNLVLLRLNPEQRLNLLKGLESVNLSNLVNAYEKQAIAFKKLDDVPQQMKLLRTEALSQMSFLSMDFLAILHGFTGTEPKNIVQSLGAANGDLLAQIKADTLIDVENEAQRKLSIHFDTNLKGEHIGLLRDKFTQISYKQNFNDSKRPFDPAEIFSASIEKVANNMNKWNIISSMISFSNGKLEDTSFFKDLSRLNIRIAGQPMSNEPQKALDQITQFVFKGKKTSFEGLTAEEKNQIGIVIGMLSQETSKTITDGVPIGLSDNHDKPLFNTSGGPQSEKASIDLDLTDSDEIRVTCNYEQDATILHYDGQDIRLNPGTKVKGSFKFHIYTSELSRLGKLDYKSLNNTPALNIFAEIGPENQGNNTRNKMERIIGTFPEDLVPIIRLDSEYSIVEPDLIQE